MSDNTLPDAIEQRLARLERILVESSPRPRSAPPLPPPPDIDYPGMAIALFFEQYIDERQLAERLGIHLNDLIAEVFPQWRARLDR